MIRRKVKSKGWMGGRIKYTIFDFFLSLECFVYGGLRHVNSWGFRIVK